ncbi:MAG: AAA family ATPase, partial [Phycisphaerae bacterium]|nr:AAA family ATPase [Phycisphaerae bacterium]
AHDAAVGEVAELSRRIDEARSQIAESEAALGRLREEAVELTQRAATLRQEREQLLFVIDEQAGAQRQLRGELEGVESQLNERRMSIGETRVRIEDLERRMREELSVELAEQYAAYQPENEDWSAVEAEIEELRGKIERLGHVNLDAITEQEELEQRLSFLTGQRDDLRESERQLQELIRKLEDESKQRFRDTFEQIRNHFGELFRKLFGGGRAEITLQDPDDVLECGIDITARPPGKEPQSIALLSGGEKTMTAIALLLAVFKTRPSPFTLLDEVDAALDEANNERFNRVIREFLSDSQFIIITHSKRTMSIADVLYGITMQEAGVSKRVAVRLEDEHGEPVSAVA